MQIQTVKNLKDFYLVNGSITVPKNSENSDYQKIEKWIEEGGIVEQEDLLFMEKQLRINRLNQNRNNFCLIPIEYNGNTYATTAEAKIAITYMITSLSTLATEAQYPNYPQGENITLTKADFKAIAALIQNREMASRDLRKSKTDEINAISNDIQYFDENGKEISALEALEAINITFE